MRAPNAETLPGPRRAAILMVLLGDEAASRLFRRLPQEQMAAVAREVAGLGTIDPDVAREVLEKYFLDAIRPDEDRGGKEVARRLLAQAELPEETRRRILGEEPDPVAGMLEPILEIPPAALAKALAQEHPQTTALILMYLPPDKAAQALRKLPDDVRPETVMRMASLRKVPGEVVGEVASSLRERLGAVGPASDEEEATDGIDRTAAILQNLKRSETRTLLETMEQQDPERADELRNRIYTFDTLLLADDRGIQELLRLVDGKNLALALHGIEEALSDKFFRNLSERASRMIKEEMEYLDSVRPEDREAAQRGVLDQALKLEQEEKLVFSEPAEDGEDGDG